MKIEEYLDNLASLFGKAMTKGGAIVFMEALNGYDENLILDALKKCATELRFFPTPADVISRIETGYFGVEEAWASIPKSENETAIFNQVSGSAYGACYELLNVDNISARMTFKEVYEKELKNAVRKKEKPIWYISVGSNKLLRDSVVHNAIRKKLITLEFARKTISDLPDLNEERIGINSEVLKLLPKAFKND